MAELVEQTVTPDVRVNGFDEAFENSIRNQDEITINTTIDDDEKGVYVGIVKAFDDETVSIFHKAWLDNAYAVVSRAHVVGVRAKGNIVE